MFRTAVNGHDVDGIASLFRTDMLFEDVAQPIPQNREGMNDWFTLVFALWPDYADSEGLVLTGYYPSGRTCGPGHAFGGMGLGAARHCAAYGRGDNAPHLGVFEFEGDKMFRFSIYSDYLGLLVQLGAVPAPEPPVLDPSIEVPDPAPTGLTPLAAVAEAQNRWNARDLAGHVSMLDTDADIFYVVMGAPSTRVQYAALLELNWLAFPDVQSQTVKAVDLGNGWVLSELVWTGTNTGPYFGKPATGLGFQLRLANLSRVNSEGLITYSHAYFDNVTLLGQLGLLSP